MKRPETALILGGTGLVGYQIALKLALTIRPQKIVIHSLHRDEAFEASRSLSSSVPGVEFKGTHGNLFSRGRAHADGPDREQSGAVEIQDSRFRWESFADTFEDFETAYRESRLAQLLLREKPELVVDSINTATGISYQDVFTTSRDVGRELKTLLEDPGQGSDSASPSDKMHHFLEDVEKLLVSAAVPQLITHVRILYRAFKECGTRIYLKIGTTGTGGLGLNIPYTHGEDRPSPTLMSKNAVAFAHTGLLFLMARTPGAPIVKELKPAAMVGYRDIGHQVVRGRQIRRIQGREVRYEWVANAPYVLYESRTETLDDTLDTAPRFDDFQPLRDASGATRELELPVVNTGENGFFTRGEFEAITHVSQMEFMTPEEIADVAVLEILGSNTGKDVISALDSAVMSPTYKAGMIRHVAIQELRRLEEETDAPSIALGQLGPPQLAKYLYETHLFRTEFATLDELLGKPAEGLDRFLETPTEERAREVSEALYERIRHSDLRDVITSIGIPILCPDGKALIRGPYLKIPGYIRTEPILQLSEEKIDEFARRGWIDLRPAHVRWWLENFQAMRMSVFAPGSKASSERLNEKAYLLEEIEVGEVVAWVFTNRIDPPGHRVK